MVETSVERQPAPVLHHHDLGVPPLVAGKQVHGGQGRDVRHAAGSCAEPVTETL